MNVQENVDILVELENLKRANEELKRRNQDLESLILSVKPKSYLEELESERGKVLATIKNCVIPYYQPKVDLLSGAIVGAEALARVMEGGKVFGPDRILKASDKYNLISVLDGVVFDKVCRDIRTWQDKYSIFVPIAVNGSTRTFENTNFVEDVNISLNKYGLSGEMVELELTEQISEEDSGIIKKNMDELIRCGIQIWIDDYGVGYSAAARLKYFPITGLKVDRSYVRDYEDDVNKILIASMFEIARNLGMSTVGEGIESVGHCAYLTELGCNHGQGYFFAKPMPAEDFGMILASGKQYDLNTGELV